MNSIATQINGYPVTVEYYFQAGCPSRWTPEREEDEYDEITIRHIRNAAGYDVFFWAGEQDVERIEREIIKHEQVERGVRVA